MHATTLYTSSKLHVWGIMWCHSMRPKEKAAHPQLYPIIVVAIADSSCHLESAINCARVH